MPVSMSRSRRAVGAESAVSIHNGALDSESFLMVCTPRSQVPRRQGCKPCTLGHAWLAFVVGTHQASRWAPSRRGVLSDRKNVHGGASASEEFSGRILGRKDTR